MNLAPRDPNTVAIIPSIKNAHTIAVLLAPRLGDSLLTVTIANNLQLDGKQVHVYGDYLHSIKNWFPTLQIMPALSEQDANKQLKNYDAAIQMHKSWPFDIHPFNTNIVEMDALLRVTGKDFVKLPQIVQFCNSYLGVSKPSFDNGLRSTDITKWRAHPKRIVIHPTSTGIQRCWDKKNFYNLALKLKHQGYEPCFIVSPNERPDWLWLNESGLNVPEFPSLSHVAEFIHQSGWFIGNESGIGHLASNLGIPTLSLTGRPTRTKCWLPGWAPAQFAYPWWIPGGRLRDKYWRSVLSPSTVLNKFYKFSRQIENDLQPPEFITKK